MRFIFVLAALCLPFATQAELPLGLQEAIDICLTPDLSHVERVARLSDAGAALLSDEAMTSVAEALRFGMVMKQGASGETTDLEALARDWDIYASYAKRSIAMSDPDTGDFGGSNWLSIGPVPALVSLWIVTVAMGEIGETSCQFVSQIAPEPSELTVAQRPPLFDAVMFSGRMVGYLNNATGTSVFVTMAFPDHAAFEAITDTEPPALVILIERINSTIAAQ